MQYYFGDCEFNTAQFTLWRANTITPLSAQACDVLHYLIVHRSRVVSKKELADQLWLDTFVSDGAIETIIKRVRRATGDNGRDQNIIKTLRGKGYRFIAPAVGLDPRESLEPHKHNASKAPLIWSLLSSPIKYHVLRHDLKPVPDSPEEPGDFRQR